MTSMPTVLPCSGNDQVDALMKQAFDRPRDPRSYSYKLGALCLLKSRVDEVLLALMYQPGTVEFDAFQSGVAEGCEIWRSQLWAVQQ